VIWQWKWRSNVCSNENVVIIIYEREMIITICNENEISKEGK